MILVNSLRTGIAPSWNCYRWWRSIMEFEFLIFIGKQIRWQMLWPPLHAMLIVMGCSLLPPSSHVLVFLLSLGIV
ncbi:hypothetical protein Taro_006049 [Colocasia esculenta]|uniref:Uncharacterized protein n=1 Tax=Colocasia esculenta TaxID=4460 RepID=A0A843TMN9_COLES|nr:hypothetical protein [Colocasia esculenta]